MSSLMLHDLSLRYGSIEAVHGLSLSVTEGQAVCLIGGKVGIVFALLVLLMLTGIPVSIALGLTVLMFLFLLTHVPVEAVALKLFSGIEKFEIMAIPLFILAGNFLTHGGVAKRHRAAALCQCPQPGRSPARGRAGRPGCLGQRRGPRGRTQLRSHLGPRSDLG